MNLRTLVRPRSAEGHRRSPLAARRPALLLSTAAAGALVVNVLAGGEPTAQADAPLESVSIASQLGITANSSSSVIDAETVRPLEQLAATRAERESEQTAAAQAQAEADQAERERRAAEEAARKAAEEKAAREAAERAAAEAAAAEAAAAPAAAPAAPAGSFQDYALAQLGGDSGQFSCLESLWGRESGWNPNAQNPSSTAYGIPQFLDSTWASTGIAKTSDGYRQIDAGLIYIQQAYGTPCGAWGHSQSTGWY